MHCNADIAVDRDIEAAAAIVAFTLAIAAQDGFDRVDYCVLFHNAPWCCLMLLLRNRQGLYQLSVFCHIAP